jgi:hypothetical protein
MWSYAPDSDGTSIADALTGAARLGEDPKIPETWFVEASNASFNTVLPSDFGFYEWNPRAGSQSYPSPAEKAAEDGSTTIWFSPEQPHGVARGNWSQTDPDKGWFTILRLYSPLPAFFDKSWRPTEIEPAQ